jgi:ribosomal protein S18 acetylase RimI-like enzyme
MSRVCNDKNVTFDEINTLMEAVGWGKYYKTEQVWNKILNSSEHVMYIRDGSCLIGFGRIVEDGIMCMFYDICVHPKYRNIGIGSFLMTELIDKVKNKEYVSIGLFTWKDNKTVDKFYEKFGFVSSHGMELVQYQKVFP